MRGNEAVHFNSRDLEMSNAAKGLAGSTTTVWPCRLKYTRYPGPQSIRSSETPSPTGLTSPGLPATSRPTRTSTAGADIPQIRRATGRRSPSCGLPACPKSSQQATRLSIPPPEVTVRATRYLALPWDHRDRTQWRGPCPASRSRNDGFLAAFPRRCKRSVPVVAPSPGPPFRPHQAGLQHFVEELAGRGDGLAE